MTSSDSQGKPAIEGSVNGNVPQLKDIFTFSLGRLHWDIFVWSYVKGMITFNIQMSHLVWMKIW